MKKILFTASLIIASLGFAGAKEDFDKAVKNFEKNQNIEELKESLVNISKSKYSKEDREYIIKANLELANIKINENKIADANFYFKKVANDKNANKEEKKAAYSGLYLLANDSREKIKYIDSLVSLEPKNNEYKIYQLVEYTLAKNSKAKTLYSNLTSKLKAEEKEAYNLIIANTFLEVNNASEALKYANYNLKSKNKETMLGTKYMLSKISLLNNNLDEALKYAEEANSLSEGKDPEILNLLTALYNSKNDFEKSFEISSKLLKNEETTDNYIRYIIQAELANKSDEADKAFNEFKSKLDDKDKTLLNFSIADLALSSGLVNIAEKYANKSLNDDKFDNANILLAQIYVATGNKEKALKSIDALKKLNIEGSENFIKELEEQLK